VRGGNDARYYRCPPTAPPDTFAVEIYSREKTRFAYELCKRYIWTARKHGYVNPSLPVWVNLQDRQLSIAPRYHQPPTGAERHQGVTCSVIAQRSDVHVSRHRDDASCRREKERREGLIGLLVHEQAFHAGRHARAGPRAEHSRASGNGVASGRPSTSVLALAQGSRKWAGGPGNA
jgi:hypothetical protein